MHLRHKSLLTLEEVEVEVTLKEEEAEEDLNEEEVETLEEAKANKTKDQRRAKLNLKMKGMTNLKLNVIIAKSMDIMLECRKKQRDYGKSNATYTVESEN